MLVPYASNLAWLLHRGGDRFGVQSGHARAILKGMRNSTLSFITLLALLGGCTATGAIDAGSVRSSADEQTPIAVWLPFATSEGVTARSTTGEIVFEVFQSEGLHPQRQEYGVSVPEAEAP